MLNVNYKVIKEGRLILKAQGEMTFGHGVRKTHQAVESLIGRYDMLIVDVSEVMAFDPVAVEMLVTVRALGEARGTKIKLCGLEMSRIRLALYIKLVTVFGPAEAAYSRAS